MIFRGKPIELVVETLGAPFSIVEANRSFASLALSPDLTRPVLAYRAWRLDLDGLLSPSARVRWTERTLVAECVRSCDGGPAHTAPGAQCRCGIYGIPEPPQPSPDGFVWGAAAFDGRVFLHENGLRAERATILALAHDDSAASRELSLAAGKLGVELVPFRELILAAGGRGAEPAPSYRDAVALGIGRQSGDADGASDAPSGPDRPHPRRPTSERSLEQSLM
jgi:hypothetical protein